MPVSKDPKKAAKKATTAPKGKATSKRPATAEAAPAIPFAVTPVNAGPNASGGYSLGVTNQKYELPLPSGAKCLAIRPGPQGLISAGLLDSMDALTAFVQTEHIDGNDPRKQMSAAKDAVAKMAGNSDQIKQGLELVDRAIAFIVQAPSVFLDDPELDPVTGGPVMASKIVNGKMAEVPVYKPRDPNKLYADQVDMMDKMFIFNWAMGGTANLIQFREEYAELMGGLSAVQNV